MKTIFKISVAAALLSLSAVSSSGAMADDSQLLGYSKGATVISPKIENGQIDTIGGIIYSQIKGLRHNRALRMTVLIPRDNKLKPAIIYFPGGGFTSADYEKYTEMRMALAKAGFVVAACEYRTVPNNSCKMVKQPLDF